MWTKYSECDCTLECDAKGIRGKPTPMNYQGNGKFICPNCKKEKDYSEYTFKIKVEVLKEEPEEDYKIGRIIEGEERINKHWEDNDKYLVIKDTLELAFAEEEYEDWVKEKKEGVYELELFYQPYTVSTQDGTFYELATEIFKETKLEVA